MDSTPSLRQDFVDVLQQRQEAVATRHAVLGALGEKRLMTDFELAEATGRDLETIRDTINALASWDIVEVVKAPRRPEGQQEAPVLTCRLIAI